MIDETFIRMVDCPEIQEGHKWDEGDWFVSIGESPSLFDGSTSQTYVIGDTSAPSHYRGSWKSDTLISECGDFDFERAIWLPTQSQLQEMYLRDMPDGTYVKIFTLLEEFYGHFEKHGYPSYAFSMEQLWLAFYMHEVHNKTWDGNTWVPA